jgi:hypothetical protein
MEEPHHDDLKRFISAFEGLNLFATSYLNKLLLEAYHEELAKAGGAALKPKSFETILETAVKRAKLYIAKHELEIIERQMKE